jgi:hypothetical protein
MPQSWQGLHAPFKLPASAAGKQPAAITRRASIRRTVVLR